MKLSNEQKIIKILFKDFLILYNSRSISKLIGITHAGAFKILIKLEERGIVKHIKIGKAKIYSLNIDNPVADKEIEMALTIEAQNYEKWLEEFKELKNKANFVILFGSIIKNEESARDIDILVIAEKDKFVEIKRVISERNKISNKKIHLILQNPEEFKKDVNNKNKVMIEIIKTGIVLFGQDKIRQMLEK